ncbi:MAG: hypothetical protein JSS81_01215 [Acidobacteria bacterium]|nr:hypothetical protein [Acidobacteriota bacterium]
MTTAGRKTLPEKFSFTSSFAADVWSPKTDSRAYEWWYFDALSDDGRDAVVIIFLDNFIFSPRYNRNGRDEEKRRDGEENGLHISAGLDDSIPPAEADGPQSRVPAVAFYYYRDGRLVCRAINEFDPAHFTASETEPTCTIGDSFFKFDSAPYGQGYYISIDARLYKNRRLKARFEWISIEGDFAPEKKVDYHDAHVWNLVVPRADVSGKINVLDGRDKELDVVHFRGTGYHDHNYDNRWLPETVRDWQWGRAHFSDSTAVFYRYQECSDHPPTTKLFTVRDGELRERDAQYDEQQPARDIFGLRYPQRLTFITDDNMRLRVKQTKVIDASFFYLRFLSEMTLTLRDGKPRKAIGITEYLNPKALKYRWLDWLVNMRIGRRGKGALLK